MPSLRMPPCKKPSNIWHPRDNLCPCGFLWSDKAVLMGGQGSESETALRRTETSKEESFVTLSRSATDIQRIVVLFANFAEIKVVNRPL